MFSATQCYMKITVEQQLNNDIMKLFHEIEIWIASNIEIMNAYEENTDEKFCKQ